MRRLFPAAGIVLFVLSAALAENDPASEFQKADKALNSAFKQVAHRLADDPASKERLIRAQRAWIAFRDAECIFRSSGEDGGSAAPMVIAGCKTTVTEDQTRQLDAYFSCEEGDLACPVPAR